jgi:release factor glutamine methyltransferase
MTNSKALFSDFMDSLTLKETREELESIAYLAFENVLGLSKTQILAGKKIGDNELIAQLQRVASRLNQHEPIQYILGEATFFGRPYLVNPAVLIPRPETEDLVRIILEYAKNQNKKLTILDIGTGSGCIAITLAIELPQSEIIAVDISPDALSVAVANARKLGASVRFARHDVFQRLPFSADIIVSNPPYIPERERAGMPRNVVDFEPEIALFVTDDDPLVFYRELILRAIESLSPNGILATEINERFGKEVLDLFIKHKFHEVEILKDVYGKERIIKGILSSLNYP